MEIKVEGKSKKYAELLKENYSGKFSDLSSFLLYKYEYVYLSDWSIYYINIKNKYVLFIKNTVSL